MSEILLIDDDEDFRDSLAQALIIEGYKVRELNQPQSALNRIGPLEDVVILSDVKMPKMSGEQLRAKVHARDPEIPVLLMTGHGEVTMAVNNLKAGAFGFFSKPLNLPEVLEECRRASKIRQAVVEKRKLEVELVGRNRLYEQLQGSSKLIQDVRRHLANVASANSNLLIVGETGTGKEVAARALHSVSQRSMQPFVPVNCSLIDEEGTGQSLFGTDEETGIFDRAKEGTLFFDEIEGLSPNVQSKLLRVLDERRFRRAGQSDYVPVRCRIVATAKPSVSSSVQTGNFRDDLYYRFCSEKVEIPPLRKRTADCAMLFEHFAVEYAQINNLATRPLTSEKLNWVMSQSWLGNVRELKSEAYNFAANRDGIPGQQIDDKPQPLAEQVAAFERMLIQTQLEKLNYDVKATAESLLTPRKTLADKIAKYGLKPN